MRGGNLDKPGARVKTPGVRCSGLSKPGRGCYTNPSMTELPFDVSPTLLLSLPGLRLYALCAVLLVLKMFAVGVYTGVVRSRLKVTTNPEDAAQYGGQSADVEPPEVARVQRAHRNDLENIPAFLALGLVAVLVGAVGMPLKVALIVFTAARFGHSLAYLNSLQPWRSVSFAMGLLSQLVLMGLILHRILFA
jgi:microsomal prostaglandin-E synthase 1